MCPVTTTAAAATAIFANENVCLLVRIVYVFNEKHSRHLQTRLGVCVCVRLSMRFVRNVQLGGVFCMLGPWLLLDLLIATINLN